MSEENNLKRLAEMAKREYQTESVPEEEPGADILPDEGILAEYGVEEPEEVVNEDFDDDDTPVIGGISNFSDDADENEDDLDDDFKITDEDLRAEMPDLSDPAFLESSSKLRTEIDTYRKNLIIRNGFTIQEANEAAMNRLKNRGKEENDAYLKENPNVGVVEIDKKNADKLEFTKDEKEKLSKVKVIQLKVVEDVDLQTLPVKRIDKKHKSAFIQSMDANLSHYSVPLPLMNDYCRFKGSQIIQLMQAVKYEDSTYDEVISRKASLVYNQLAGGTNLKKYDDDGKVIMSYQEFINKFLYHDLDMALFGILVASSMEVITTDLTCGHCNTPFQWEYNLKRLLNLDDLNDDFKAKFDDILAHKTNSEYLQTLYEREHKATRVKSPITGNVYELSYPTVGRAINLYKLIDQKDETMMYLSAFALFVSKAWIKDVKSEEYVLIEEDEYRALLDALQVIPQEEIDIIQMFLKRMVYIPKFILKSKCPVCGNDMSNELEIDDLVFLRAQDSSTEIR